MHNTCLRCVRRVYTFSLLACCLLLLLVSCSTNVGAQFIAPTSRIAPTSHPAGKPLTSMPETYTGPINRPVATTGCGQNPSIKPGSSATITIAMNPAVAEGNHTRVYRVHVPLGYNPRHSIAVVLSFHGHGGSALNQERDSGFSALADQQDFLAVYGQGLLEGSGKPFWADIGPIDFGIDDLQYVSNVLDDLQKKFCVDPTRIYATGFSNGGGMTEFLACRLAGRIAAFAPMSGDYYNPPGGCHPGRPVALLETHGSADPLVRYNGVPASAHPAWPLPSIPQFLQQWAARDGCTVGPSIFYNVPPVVGEQWTHCRANVSIVHYRVNGAGHTGPPPIHGQSSAAIIWQFFQRYTLPHG